MPMLYTDTMNIYNEFEKQGLQAFDALLLACAEGNADILLTVDDKFQTRPELFKTLMSKSVTLWFG
jgi:hypothetical protein